MAEDLRFVYHENITCAELLQVRLRYNMVSYYQSSVSVAVMVEMNSATQLRIFENAMRPNSFANCEYATGRRKDICHA
jgi:hypothetical protein